MLVLCQFLERSNLETEIHFAGVKKMTTNEFDGQFNNNNISVDESLIGKMNCNYISIKRFFDIVLALILFIPSAIIIFAFGILVKLESKGPMLYSQQRVGINGKYFMIFKLRSMYDNADMIGPLYTAESDNRITKVGKIIRKLRIDELPQLLNILRGEMSFIGPRPLTGYEYDISNVDFNQRLLVLPGISGLAQVSGGNNHTNEQKLECDLNYIKNISMKLDFKILCKTIVVIFSGNGAR